MLKIHHPLCWLVFLLGLASAFPAVSADTYEHQLSNGLRIIVREDRRAPTVVHMIWYRVGSMDETNGTTGVAHLLEHMMFKGTPTFGPGEFSRIVTRVGGRDNAFTGKDYTAYFQQIPKQQLDRMMHLEADRMRHLTLDPKEFEQEIKVVMEERRTRTDDRPLALLAEHAFAAAFQAHPYRAPVIGWMNDLENMTVYDARAWYERWYLPGNAYVVVVGDVDHRDVFALAERHYGTLKPRALPDRKPQTEPPQRGLRRLIVKAPAKLHAVLMAYKVPVIRDIENDTDPFALEVLSAIMGGHDTGRLTRGLVRQERLAASASAGYDAISRGPGLFYLRGSPSEGKTRAELEAGFRSEITKIAENGVSEEELAYIRNRLVAAQIYKLDSMFGQAMEIGELEASGLSFRDENRIIEKFKAVTADDVKAVARKYFGDDSLTVAELDPQPLSETTPRKTALP
ncbi:MAG: insulinase family protein [Candidatus Accumulibacter sp.]|jgi:zinc protease|nr:insulinase family protein [Accumulibacter sp.]